MALRARHAAARRAARFALTRRGVVGAAVNALKTNGELNLFAQTAEETRDIAAVIERLQGVLEAIATEEHKLGCDSIELGDLSALEKKFEPFGTLWGLVASWNAMQRDWSRKSVFTLDAEGIAKEIEEMLRTAFKLSKSLLDSAPAAAKVATVVRMEIDRFRAQLPLLRVVCNPNMQDRHWRDVMGVVGINLKADKGLDLKRLLDLGLDRYLPRLEPISEAATKEHAIEVALMAMSQEWNGMAFDVRSYKDTGTFILGGGALDDIAALLDDHLVKIAMMRGTPFAAPYAESIAERESFLKHLQATVDVWLAVQATWLYLQPIFASDDITKQMPVEASKFSVVDGSWRSVMRVAAGSPTCPAVDSIDGILERLREARGLLDEIQGGLETYLESKRLRFARFFFLSNDELLEILAETKDPTRAQPFLKKCFEGIASLDFDARGVIGGMCSGEGEAISFGHGSTVDPRALRNAVEEWLLAVETSMRVTLAQRMRDALAAYGGGKARTAWATSWPGQLVLNGSQVFWTAEVESALAAPGGLKAYAATLHAQLGDIVALVRGDLGRLARQTLSALTVIDVHQRDVVDGLVAEGGVTAGSFEWTSQLRYYAIPGAAEGGGMGISVRMINSALDYAYEYLGNTGRLVITPLTDRCYRTLMGALQLQYGGAPEGPAGTGKTETTKDLAKALARQCVVFNCSDQLDVRAMGKFFKGLASSGAWACFDEFNRIHLEVLSVIAQQVTSIQRAIAAQQTSFVFEGTTIALKWTANVFITMNPGYAGRSALPDNLKALFRSVAMMVPDYAMIAEITLYSMGYMDARPLSQKIVAAYKLCSEQVRACDSGVVSGVHGHT